MVKGIVDNAGGKIWFESALNKGTTFFVEMPLKGMQKKEGGKKIEQST
jgi:signal transduction histidine kinase